MDVVKKIVKQSVKILIAASIISSIGGIGFEALKLKIAAIVPLMIMLPALNDLIGDFGIIISSKFTTLFYQRKLSRNWWMSAALGDQFRLITSIAFFAAFYLGIGSSAIAWVQGNGFEVAAFAKVLAISFTTTVVLVSAIFFIAVAGGIWAVKHRKDPNNFLIPMTTSIADMLSLIVFTLMVVVLF